MRNPLRAVLPERLGSDFRWLIASSWTTNLGDGIALAAGPLLIDAATDDPALVGFAWLLSRLPWLLFGLNAGVVADRLDRRTILLVANGFRVVVLAVFAAAIAGASVSVWMILGALFLLGTAEVFVDSTGSTLMPMIVPTEELTTANARMTLGLVTLNQLVGPPVGAALFVIGMWLPFAAQGVITAAGALMILRILGARGRPDSASAGRSMRTAIREGIRWLLGHARVRTLALLIFAFNITFGAAFSVLVVLATDRLGLDEFGFGLLTAAAAVGGVIGSTVFGWAEQRFGVVAIMRFGLLVETVTHLVLATTTDAAIAFAVLIVFGVHAAMWATLSTSIRQAAVPLELQGRVVSVYQLGLQGGLVIGAGIGSVLAGVFGVTAPYWFGFVGSALILALVWRQIRHIAVVAADGG